METLGGEFNRMASQLQASYATLEGKVEERTAALQLANLAKSRFLAVASHDLRQPLHALNLLIAQLRGETDQHERVRVVAHVEAAVANINELFNALLDISKLDAGAMTATISDFPVAGVLRRIDATFAAAAHDKGLHFAVVSSSAIVRSDPILLERILLNLVSNAIRYTDTGGVVLGCRPRGDRLRIDVCDSGTGIADDQQRIIFAEFYRGLHAEQHSGDGLVIVPPPHELLPAEIRSTTANGGAVVLRRAVPPLKLQLERISVLSIGTTTRGRSKKVL